MNNILIIARKEVQEGLRNRWVFATTLLLAALALTLTFLGSAPTGNVGANALDVVIVSLSSLTIFLVPLIALLISHDAIVGEVERGTMLLLLSYPVGRWQVLAGKFLGHLGILAFATLLGLLVVDQGQLIGGSVLNALLLANPADAYRLLNLSSGDVSALSGMGGVAENAALSSGVLVSALAIWALMPLAAAALVFARREL